MFSSANLYLNKPEGIIVGVDGGDGNYSIVNGDDAIVTAAFVKVKVGTNVYRLFLKPKVRRELR